ncbi:MAG: S1 RNA-binding domain-containing protein [Chloroflexi bacterium]|nr:S1 RNA-binding domain-containing protein [Chloroflexota bacterium]
MNANISGLGETEELQNSSPTAESPEQPTTTETIDTAAETTPAANGAPDEAPMPSATEEQVAEHEAGVDASSEPDIESEPAGELTDNAAEPATETEPAGEWLNDAAAPDLKPFKRGDVVEGTVTSTSPTAVYVDVGGKGEGVIPGRELERMNRETLDLLKPGSVIPVYVVNPNDHKGEMILSVNRALEELDWRKAEEHKESQEVYESHVAGYNKGGLIVRFGRLRGFVPQSQLGADRKRQISGETPEDRWGAMVNEPIAVKVMEVDRARNRLILSERAAARESRESRKESLISRLKVGEVRTGRVVSLVDFGAFVDIGGAEGLVHLTELSWKHVTHPREILRIGQEVTVEVISIDPDAKRIGLSLKRQEADPWDTIATDFMVGQLVQGRVTKLTKFGAFTQLVDVPEIEGLVHISELSDQRVNHPREVVKEGEVLTLRVVKMDIENRRLGLSLKRVNSAEYLDMDWSSPQE